MFATGFSAMGKTRLFVSSDVEETQEKISAVMQPHRLRPLSSDRYHHGHMDFVRLPTIGIGAITFGAMELDLEAVADYHLLIFCRRGRAEFSVDREDVVVDSARGVALAPGERVRARFSQDCEQVIFRIDASAWRRLNGRNAPFLRRAIDIQQHRLRPWTMAMRAMLDDAATIDLLLADERVAADCEALFYSMLLSGDAIEEGDRGTTIAPAAVRRAESYIDAHFAEPLRLDDISAVAGVPVRTLLDQFRRFRDVTPSIHLRNRRLDAARDALTQGRQAVSVIDVANAVGLGNAGRFARSYFARFGELPSDTRSRSA